MMSNFELIEKIEGEEIERRINSLIGYRKIKEMERLIVDDRYYIIRKMFSRYITYTHFQNGEIIKICVYGRKR